MEIHIFTEPEAFPFPRDRARNATSNTSPADDLDFAADFASQFEEDAA